MSKYETKTEDFYFASTSDLVQFLEREWDYSQSEIDRLLDDKYEDDCYSDAHEHTTTETKLISDGQGWYLSTKINSTLFDNYI